MTDNGNQVVLLKAQAYDLVVKNGQLNKYCAMLEEALRRVTESDKKRPIQDILKDIEDEHSVST